MTTILKPGILVSLKTTLTGGVRYQVRDLASVNSADGSHVAQWETTRTIDDPAEHARAVKVRADAANKIRSACAHTAFGLLCPESQQAELDAAVTEARAMVADFNATAQCSAIHVYVLTGRIASTDDEAARAIASEIQGLLAEIDAGVRGCNPTAIRAACSRAKALGAILGDEQAATVQSAVQAARDAARAIVKRVVKDGESAEVVLADLDQSLKPIETARFAFLDLSEPEQITEPAPDMPAVALQRFADLDCPETIEVLKSGLDQLNDSLDSAQQSAEGLIAEFREPESFAPASVQAARWDDSDF